MSKSLQSQITGDTISTPGDRLTGVYGGLAAAVRGYIGSRLTGALGIPSTPITAALAVAEAMDSLSASAYITVMAEASGTARSAASMMMQPNDTRYYTVSITTPFVGTHTYELDGTDDVMARYGPSWTKVDTSSDWMWDNAGGDWIDSTGTRQGTSHWATSVASMANGSEYSVDVTSMVNYAFTNDRRMAILGQQQVSAPRTIANRANLSYPAPRISVVYADTSTADLACTFSGLIYSTSGSPSTWGDLSAAGSNRAILEFQRPTQAVTSATLHYTVITHWSGSGGTVWDLLDPPTTNALEPTGIAPSLGFADLNIDLISGVIGAQRTVDSAVASDFISTATWSPYDSQLSPEFWGGAVDTSKLPYSARHPTTGKDRWVNAAGYGGMSLVASTYTGFGFQPLAPGISALMLSMNGNVGAQTDGYVGNSSGTTGSVAKIFMPPDMMGELDHIRIRFYFRKSLGGRTLSISDRKVYYHSTLSSTDWDWTNYTGKWGITPAHDNNVGGVSGSSGGGYGWQMRLQWQAQIPTATGPDVGRWAPGFHIKSDFQGQNPAGYNYNSLGLNENWGNGGWAAALEFDKWYCVETELKLNTLLPSGDGFLPDGILRAWVDGRLVWEKTDMVMRSLPVANGVGAAIITPGGTNVGNGTLTDDQTYASGGQCNKLRCIPETITLTLTSATTYSVVGSFYGAYASGTVGVAYNTDRHAWTMNAGSTPFVAGDKFTVVMPQLYTAPRAAGSSPMRNLGVRDIWANWFHGGKTEIPYDMRLFYSLPVWADGSVVSHIGQANLVPPVSITGTAWTPNRDSSGNVLATDLQNLPLNTALTIVGSSFGQVLDTPDLLNLRSGTPSKDYLFAAWSGGVYVPTINSVVCPGQGGHGDTAMHDNAVLSFSFDTMKWSRLRSRSPGPRIYNGTAWVDGGTSMLSEGFPLADGAPSCQHNFFGVEWLPGSVVGNTKGMVYRPGYTSGLFDLDTLAWKPLHYLYGTSKSASNSQYMRLANGQLWGIQETPHQWQRFDPSASVTGPAGASYGNYTTMLSGGGTWAYDRQIVAKIYSRGEIATIGRPAADTATVECKRFRIDSACGALGSGGDITPYIDTITLSGPDVSDFTGDSTQFSDLTTGSPVGRWCHALCVDDSARSRLLVWGNFVGDCVYAITGLSTSTWTITKIAGTGALQNRFGSGKAGHGPYGRGALWTSGSAYGLVSLSSDYSEDPMIIRLG